MPAHSRVSMGNFTPCSSHNRIPISFAIGTGCEPHDSNGSSRKRFVVVGGQLASTNRLLVFVPGARQRWQPQQPTYCQQNKNPTSSFTHGVDVANPQTKLPTRNNGKNSILWLTRRRVRMACFYL